MANKIEIDFNANVARFVSGIDKATNSLEKFQRNAKRRSNELKKVFRGLGSSIGIGFSGFAIGSLASDLVDVNRRFEVLKKSLIAVTGSAEKADNAFDKISVFAKETPYQLSEVVNAFRKMTALGLQPSMKDLESFGNTASAMGKSLDQFIEAIADASTREFERLKEFGIKAKSQGDKVSFTFQNVTKTINKSSKEIVSYLKDIGNVQFAGAMTEQMDTIEGSFSNLKDSLDQLALTIGESGLNEAVADLTNDFTDLVREATAFIKTFQGAQSYKTIEDVETRIKAVKQSIMDAGQALTSFSLDNLSPSTRLGNIISLVLDKRELEQLEARLEELRNKPLVIDVTYDATGGAGVKTLKKAIDDMMGPAKEWNLLQKEGIKLMRAVKTPTEEFADAVQRVGLLFERGFITEETAHRAIQKYADELSSATSETDQLADAWKDAAESMASGFADAIVEGKKFSDVLRSLAQDMLRLFVHKTITASLVDAFTGAISGKAMGGPVSSGTPYLVGEKGPELFVPGASGNIVPNGAMGGVNQYITVNANGADLGTVERLKQVAAQMGRNLVYDELSRNGPMRGVL